MTGPGPAGAAPDGLARRTAAAARPGPGLPAERVPARVEHRVSGLDDFDGTMARRRDLGRHGLDDFAPEVVRREG